MKYILFERKGRIGYITLNRPEKKNALNSELVSELKRAFYESQKDPEIKVIVLKASGDSFCAGADLLYLQGLQNNTLEENLEDSNNLMELYKLIYTLNKVVIAQINGHAIAGGCGLVSVCDFAFSTPDANFGYSEVKIGFINAIVMVFLLRKLNESHAKQLLLSGNLINASKAQEIGLIYEVVQLENLEEVVDKFALKLCDANSQKSMELIKTMISKIPELPLEDALSYASAMNAEARSSEDCKKGISNFLNKKKIEW